MKLELPPFSEQQVSNNASCAGMGGYYCTSSDPCLPGRIMSNPDYDPLSFGTSIHEVGAPRLPPTGSWL